MKTYLVGGAVRDRFLGIESKDKDYLVLEATPEEMKRLGYTQVGIGFPIYLHPKTKEEYAFPRGASLEEDLHRRDLTINSMAMDPEGKLIDPHGGLHDLNHKILRHTSEAFAEDPFRVYRVLRFKARFPDFTIAPETWELMQKISSSEIFHQIDPERMIKELRVVLSLPRPSLFFEGLKEMGALTHFFPELQALIGVPENPQYQAEGDVWSHTMKTLDLASKLTPDIIIRYSALVHALGKGMTPKEGPEESGVELIKELASRILAPIAWTEAAVVVARFHLHVFRIFEMIPSSIVEMFYEMDGFRRPYLVEILATVCEADALVRHRNNSLAKAGLIECFEAIKKVSFKDIPPGITGRDIGDAIKEKRIKVLKLFIEKSTLWPVAGL